MLSFGIWTLGLALVVAFNLRYEGQSDSFRGVADTLETVITTESVSEIARIHVASGQTVRKGDTLVRLSRIDLDQRQEQINRERQHVQGQTQASATDLDRRVNEIRASLETRRSQIRLEVRQLRELSERSQDLARRLQVSGVGAPSDTSAAQIRIKGLEHELAVAESSAKSQISLLQGSRGTQNTGGLAQNSSFSAEAKLLDQERSRLVLLAPQDGVIGSVFFREHDKVNAFAPIVSMMARYPTLVHGYLQENIAASLAAGDCVTVASTIHSGHLTRGLVVGLGTRIIEMPIRLRKVPTLPVWGREVTIRIPAENRFLLGELVSIRSMKPTGGLSGWFKP
jgi:HlyD family secretion protein